MADKSVSLKAGDILIRQGEKNPDRAYMVLNGQLEIYTENNGKKQHIAYVGPRQVVGEVALIDGSPRTAYAVATVPTECDSMDRITFDSCLKQSNPFVVALLRVLSARYRALMKKVEQQS